MVVIPKDFRAEHNVQDKYWGIMWFIFGGLEWQKRFTYNIGWKEQTVVKNHIVMPLLMRSFCLSLIFWLWFYSTIFICKSIFSLEVCSTYVGIIWQYIAGFGNLLLFFGIWNEFVNPLELFSLIGIILYQLRFDLVIVNRIFMFFCICHSRTLSVLRSSLLLYVAQ